MARILILGIMSMVLVGSQFPAGIQAQQTDFEKYMQQQNEGFSDFRDAEAQYKEGITKEYQAYLQQQRQEYENFKDEVEKKWDNFRGNTVKEFVNYDKNLDSRGAINFDQGQIEIEVIEDANSPNPEQNARKKIAEQVTQLVKEKGEKDTPLLKDQVKDNEGQVVTSQNADKFAKDVASTKDIKVKTYKAKDGTSRKKYAVTVKMVPDHVAKRATLFKDDVLEESKRFKIDPRVAFAVMQTESFFNPKARSHIPAFGLMQLVPSSGARDAYLYVYNQDKLLTADYLFQPKNNVELGCAYIGKVRHVYFRKITDNKSAYYCTIAAYNTGPGNVAKALTGATSLNKMVATANSHDSDWIYKKLIRDLPYKETQDYLKKVTDRMSIYDPWM